MNLIINIMINLIRIHIKINIEMIIETIIEIIIGMIIGKEKGILLIIQSMINIMIDMIIDIMINIIADMTIDMKKEAVVIKDIKAEVKKNIIEVGAEEVKVGTIIIQEQIIIILIKIIAEKRKPKINIDNQRKENLRKKEITKKREDVLESVLDQIRF